MGRPMQPLTLLFVVGFHLALIGAGGERCLDHPIKWGYDGGGGPDMFPIVRWKPPRCSMETAAPADMNPSRSPTRHRPTRWGDPCALCPRCSRSASFWRPLDLAASGASITPSSGVMTEGAGLTCSPFSGSRDCFGEGMLPIQIYSRPFGGAMSEGGCLFILRGRAIAGSLRRRHQDPMRRAVHAGTY